MTVVPRACRCSTRARPNVGAGGRPTGVRYLLDTQSLEDENTGVNPQPIKVRLLNLKLLLSTQDHTGYEALADRPGREVAPRRGDARSST